MDSRETRAREIQRAIREVLLREWDPIGVKDVPEAQDEYDVYVGAVYHLVASGASVEEIAEHLTQIEQNAMGLSADSKARHSVAMHLRQLDVGLRSKKSL